MEVLQARKGGQDLYFLQGRPQIIPGLDTKPLSPLRLTALSPMRPTSRRVTAIAGAKWTLKAPFGRDAVLYIRRKQ